MNATAHVLCLLTFFVASVGATNPRVGHWLTKVDAGGLTFLALMLAAIVSTILALGYEIAA